jgi:hypothetical protein
VRSIHAYDLWVLLSLITNFAVSKEPFMPVGDIRIRKLLKKLYNEVDKVFEEELERRLKQERKASARKLRTIPKRK